MLEKYTLSLFFPSNFLSLRVMAINSFPKHYVPAISPSVKPSPFEAIPKKKFLFQFPFTIQISFCAFPFLLSSIPCSLLFRIRREKERVSVLRFIVTSTSPSQVVWGQHRLLCDHSKAGILRHVKCPNSPG